MPELRSLTGDARRIWTDASVRRKALDDIVRALDRGGTELREAVQRADEAVVQGLQALGFPRGPVQTVEIEQARTLWAGRKDPRCPIYFAADTLRANARLGRLDTSFRTWVHESLHARQPYADDHRQEYARWPGYEEGLVEGLARYLLQERAGITDIGGSVEYFVVAYRTLAETIGVEPHALWGTLWHVPAGRVRAALPTVVRELAPQPGRREPVPRQLAHVQAIADTVFGPGRQHYIPDPAELSRLWRVALR